VPKTLFLVDGSNHAFRVHFALPPMHTATGFPTRTLYGFTTLFAKLLRDHDPDYVVVSFDTGSNFRHEIFPDYKGHRPDMPDDLAQQWPRLPELVEGFGYRCLMVDGFEADDVLGTLAQLASDDLEVSLVTGDKDFFQLVGPNVRIIDLMKDVTLGPADVPAKFGVGASQVVDVLALAGDSSDNIPGVPGIGPKTASKLILEYGSLEAVLDAAPGIKGKRGENLRNHADDARMSKQLATIRVDVPLGVELTDLQPEGMQVAALRELFDEWEFGPVAKRLLPAQAGIDTSVWRPFEAADAASIAQCERVAVMFEGDRASACWAPDQVRVGTVAELLPMIATADIVATSLKRCDQVFGRPQRPGDGDIFLLDYLLNAHAPSHSLTRMSARYLSHELAQSGPAQQSLLAAPTNEDARIAEQAQVMWLLYDKLLRRMDDGVKSVYAEVELPLVHVLSDMERVGIRLDTVVLGRIRDEIAERMDEAEARCHAIAGREFNVGSRHVLRDLLFEELGYEPGKRVKDGWSTDSSVLDKLVGQRDPDLPAAVLEYRSLQKLVSTYLDKLPSYVGPDGRVHTTFHQAVTATGRLSSSDPNLQNIPIRKAVGRRVRDAFVPAEGCVFLSADYSQVELRVLAHVVGDGPLAESFRRGDDIHARTASEVFGIEPEEVTVDIRSAAKAINFGLVYGMSAFRLAGDLHITRDEAKRYMDEYFARMPMVADWLEATRASARKLGFVRTLYGRRRVLPGIHAKNRAERAAAEREAVNTVIQGTAADLIKLAMARVDTALREQGLLSRILLQVHDELLLEVPENELLVVSGLVKRQMEQVADLSVPLAVNTAIGRTWNEAHG
jgi:DNA polymerase-1